jgi:hypothetical protein
VWCQQCVAVRAWGCLWWIPTQKDAKTQFLAPWHPVVAATNNLMTDLYSANEMSGLWPGLGPQKNPLKTGRRTSPKPKPGSRTRTRKCRAHTEAMRERGSRVLAAGARWEVSGSTHQFGDITGVSVVYTIYAWPFAQPGISQISISNRQDHAGLQPCNSDSGGSEAGVRGSCSC